MELVKDMQRLQGIDDEYDNDSGSGPDRVGRRRTIHNLAKHAQKKRQIGTLDVAFKRRFLNFTANGGNPGTPILSRSNMAKRRETIKALENRRNNVLAERKKSQMQTLGANNDYGKLNGGGIQPIRNHRNSTISVTEVFNQGHINEAYIADEMSDRNSVALQPRSTLPWNNNNRL